MDFENKFDTEWKNEGTEPSAELKTNGFQSGYKPAAAVFNWFWSKVIKAITELQDNMINSSEKSQEILSSSVTLSLDPRTNNEDYLIDGNDYSIEEPLCCLGFSGNSQSILNQELLQHITVTKDTSSTEYNVSSYFKAKKDCKIEISANIHFNQSCESNYIKQFGIYIAKNTVESATKNDILEFYVENYFTAQQADLGACRMCVNMNLSPCTLDLKKDESFSIWVPNWATEGLRYNWVDRGKYNRGFLNIKILDYQN